MSFSVLIDETGNRYGRLQVLRRDTSEPKPTRWLCECDCGNVTSVRAWLLRSGATKSCGCLKAEQVPPSQYKHGEWATPLYVVWHGMKQRCENPNDKGYYLYGALGVQVCPEWSESFEAFRDDMGPRPDDPPGWDSKRAYWSIDRIDPNGDYTPENCRWATHSEQQFNRRDRQ